MSALLHRLGSFTRGLTSVLDFTKPETIMHVIGSFLMVGGIVSFDTGFILLQITTQTYFYSFYWLFVVFGSLATIFSVCLTMHGLRHYSIIWMFFLSAILAACVIGAPFGTSLTQVISRPQCENYGIGNYCMMNRSILVGCSLFVPGLIFSFFAAIKGCAGTFKIKNY